MVGKNDISLLELELELAFPAAERRIHVRGDSGTFFARAIASGPFALIVVPWTNDAEAADYVAGNLHGKRIQLLERVEPAA